MNLQELALILKIIAFLVISVGVFIIVYRIYKKDSVDAKSLLDEIAQQAKSNCYQPEKTPETVKHEPIKPDPLVLDLMHKINLQKAINKQGGKYKYISSITVVNNRTDKKYRFESKTDFGLGWEGSAYGFLSIIQYEEPYIRDGRHRYTKSNVISQFNKSDFSVSEIITEEKELVYVKGVTDL